MVLRCRNGTVISVQILAASGRFHSVLSISPQPLRSCLGRFHHNVDEGGTALLADDTDGLLEGGSEVLRSLDRAEGAHAEATRNLREVGGRIIEAQTDGLVLE